MPTIVQQTPKHNESLSEFTIYVDDILEHGLDQTIMLHVVGMCELPQYSELRRFEGHRWCRVSLDRFQELCPFWKRTKISGLIRELEHRGLILSTTKINEDSTDRTKWYRCIYDFDPEEVMEIHLPHHLAYEVK